MSKVDQEKTERLSALVKNADCIWFESTGSTNDDVKECIKKNGCLTNIIRVADFQTKGRGTHGRTWDNGRLALLMSVGVRLNTEIKNIPGITLVIGAAVVNLLRKTGENVFLKWPNDIYLKGKKLGGILTEVVKQEGDSVYLVVGIGLNIIASNAQHASLEINKSTIDIIELSSNIGQIIIFEINQYSSRSLKKLQKNWSRIDAFYGRKIEVFYENTVVAKGFIHSITEEGYLKVICEETQESKVFISATVREIV